MIARIVGNRYFLSLRSMVSKLSIFYTFVKIALFCYTFSYMKIIFIGDIIGKIGRKAVAKILLEWKEKFQPDLVIANAENLAHGIGVTEIVLEEVRKAGVDFFTTGNHWHRKEEGINLFSDNNFSIIRPANWPGNVPGVGFKIIEVGATAVAIINLLGQVFIKENINSPFFEFDKIFAEISKKAKIIIVDFHAEATSEKMAFAWHVDGRASAVLGTHTHVPTADARILSLGTGFISDIGMVGALDSIIGDQKEEIIANFLDQRGRRFEIPESGLVQVNAVALEINNTTGWTEKIERLDTVVEI